MADRGASHGGASEGALSLKATVDIEVSEHLIARVTPTAMRSTYSIQVGILVEGLFVCASEPFEATFGVDFDVAIEALGA